MIGAGGLGVPVLQYLAAAGVGRITIVDGDVVDASNLHRQPIYGRADVGRPKAAVAADQIARLNRDVRCDAIAQRADAANLPGLVAASDLVVECTENLRTKFLVNDAVVRAGRPAVFASVYQYEGHIQAYLPVADWPCLRCLWPEAPRDGLVGNCAEAGVLGPVPAGLRLLLSTHPDFEIVGEAEDGRAAIGCVEKLKPNLILTDLSMPKMNGMEAIREIRKKSRETKILVLTVHKTEEYILNTLQAGADGYLLKDSTHTELRVAVKHVLGGRRYLSPEISDVVLEGYLEGKKTVRTQTTWETLTHREREILKLIAEGHRNKEIADDLCISVKTVEKHRSNLMEKLGLHNVQALTAYAIEKGLVSRE